MLLSRDEFRQQVFARDGGRCVICSAPGQDAHHILERRLFDDGGYYLDNGATLCAACHVKAEMTVLSCDAIRAAIDGKSAGSDLIGPLEVAGSFWVFRIEKRDTQGVYTETQKGQLADFALQALGHGKMKVLDIDGRYIQENRVQAGDLVTTGTCVAPVTVSEGDRMRADFGDLGSLEMSLASAS